MMKKYTKLLCLALAGVASQSALATGEEIKGNTTCSILQNNKLIKKAPCSYTGLVFGSIRYNENSYNFKVKGYGNISSSSSVSAKQTKDGEMIENKDGSVDYQDPIITLNKKPAIGLYRDGKTLKIIPNTYYDKHSEKLKNSTLSCTQQIKTKLEVCMPVKDEALS